MLKKLIDQIDDAHVLRILISMLLKGQSAENIEALLSYRSGINPEPEIAEKETVETVVLKQEPEPEIQENVQEDAAAETDPAKTPAPTAQPPVKEPEPVKPENRPLVKKLTKKELLTVLKAPEPVPARAETIFTTPEKTPASASDADLQASVPSNVIQETIIENLLDLSKNDTHELLVDAVSKLAGFAYRPKLQIQVPDLAKTISRLSNDAMSYALSHTESGVLKIYNMMDDLLDHCASAENTDELNPILNTIEQITNLCAELVDPVRLAKMVEQKSTENQN